MASLVRGPHNRCTVLLVFVVASSSKRFLCAVVERVWHAGCTTTQQPIAEGLALVTVNGMYVAEQPPNVLLGTIRNSQQVLVTLGAYPSERIQLVLMYNITSYCKQAGHGSAVRTVESLVITAVVMALHRIIVNCMLISRS